MSTNIGINVIEVDGRATPSIQPAATSVSGFVIKAERGISGKTVKITNWGQFTEHFGSYISSANGAYAIRGFFDNGGTTAYVTRVVYSGTNKPTAAMIMSKGGTWKLKNGDNLSFKRDGVNAPFVVTFKHGAAILQGAKEPFNLSSENNPLNINFTVDGVIGNSYQFQASDFPDSALATATVDEVKAVINRQFSGIQAFVEQGNLVVRTDKGNAEASLSASGTAAETLGFGAATVRGTGNVANINAVTAVEAKVAINKVLGSEGFEVTQSGGKVKITRSEAGAAHWLQVVVTEKDPVPVIFGFNGDKATGKDADTNNAATAATKNFSNRLTVTAGYRGHEDVGAWGNKLKIEIKTNTENAQYFDLIVRYQNQVVETWSGLDMTNSNNRFAESIINDEYSGSKYIIVAAKGTASPEDTLTESEKGVKLERGSDGKFPISETEQTAYAKSIDLFKLVKIQLLCCPESHNATVVSNCLTHCENMGDRMFIGHTPEEMESANIKDAYSKKHQKDNAYGALYFPWIQVADPLGSRRWIPPTGHIMGTYARTERERGIWKAPAGNAASLNNVLDVKHHITDVDHTDLVKNASVNAVRFISGQGIIIDSSRTLSTNPLWLYVNVRLLFNFVKSSLGSSLRWVVQEPNDDTLWNKVKYNSVTPFLMGLWRRGAFGPGSPEDVFTVKIDAENNPPANIQQGIFNVEIYFYPSRPAETIVITVGQQEGGSSASEG